MEEKIKELEYENRHLQKELREQYRLLEIAKKREIWYNQNKYIFTKSLDSEYQENIKISINDMVTQTQIQIQFGKL